MTFLKLAGSVFLWVLGFWMCNAQFNHIGEILGTGVLLGVAAALSNFSVSGA